MFETVYIYRLTRSEPTVLEDGSFKVEKSTAYPIIFKNILVYDS